MYYFKQLYKIVSFPFSIILATVGLVVGFCLLITFLIPSLLYKRCVLLLAKSTWPKAQIMSYQSDLFAGGHVYKNKLAYQSLQLIVKGKIEVESFRESFNKNVIQAKRFYGDTRFPELQCYVRSFLGYSFYIPVKQFRLQDHINVYELKDCPKTKSIDKVELNEIRMANSSVLFKKFLSPWEILIINNYTFEGEKDNGEKNSNNSVIIFKYHNCLADVFATFILFWNALGGVALPPLSAPTMSRKRRNALEIVGKMILEFFKSAYDFWKIGFTFFYSPGFLKPKKKLPLREISENEKQISNAFDVVSWSLAPFKSSLVKEISQVHNIRITTALMAATFGAYEKFVKSRGVQIPKYVEVFFPLPLPEHPDRLKCHSAITRLQIPTGSNPQRLKIMDHNYKVAVRRSWYFGMKITKYVCNFVPLSFEWMPQLRWNPPAVYFSFTPLPSDDVSFGGCQILETYFCIENSCFKFSPGICVLEYKENFFITFNIPERFLDNKDDVSEIEHYLLEELQCLSIPVDLVV